jgi:hypothetical protein
MTEWPALWAKKVIICPGPAAIGFWPHRLRVAFAGKEEFRGAYRLDKIGQ